MLTQKREAYVIALALEGLSQRKAYRKAYPTSQKWRDEIVDSKACQLLAVEDVRFRYDELQMQVRKQAEESGMLTCEKLLKTCEKVIDDETVNLNTKAKYIDIAAKMLGAYNAKLSVIGESITTVEYVFGDDAKA